MKWALLKVDNQHITSYKPLHKALPFLAKSFAAFTFYKRLEMENVISDKEHFCSIQSYENKIRGFIEAFRHQGGNLFYKGRLIFHILDVENNPRKTSVPSYVE